MTGQGVLINEDAMEEAWKTVRARKNKPPEKPASLTAQAWMALERRRRDLETQLKAVVSEQEKCRVRLLDEWATEGINREVVDGYTIHTQRKLYPKVADRAGLAIALNEAGFADLLTVDDRAFGIYLTACDENGKPLPDSIGRYVNETFERFAIVVKLK